MRRIGFSGCDTFDDFAEQFTQHHGGYAGKHNGIQRARTAEIENLTDAAGPVDYACCGVGEQNTQYAGNERASAGTTEQPREDAAA